MLQIVIPAADQWNETKEEFLQIKGQTLVLEHSLVSLSKWESKWCRAFLSKQEKTVPETIDYIKCMTLTQNVDSNVYYALTQNNIQTINAYIDAPMTATYFSEDDTSNYKSSREKITAELIYYWMIAYNIPFDCQKWHLNKLLTLIRVCHVKNQKPKKRSKRELMRRHTALNAMRRQQLNSKG